jgi:hypothetical protein
MLPLSASHVAGITGMSTGTRPDFLKRNPGKWFLSAFSETSKLVNSQFMNL